MRDLPALTVKHYGILEDQLQQAAINIAQNVIINVRYYVRLIHNHLRKYPAIACKYTYVFACVCMCASFIFKSIMSLCIIYIDILYSLLYTYIYKLYGLLLYI